MFAHIFSFEGGVNVYDLADDDIRPFESVPVDIDTKGAGADEGCVERLMS